MPTIHEARSLSVPAATLAARDRAPPAGGKGGHDHGHDHPHDHDHAHHDHHHEHGHDHDEDEGHGHDHAHGVGWLDAARIGVALICAALLWFKEAFFFSPGSMWEAIHDFASKIEIWQYWALSDLIPDSLRAAMPVGLYNWIDEYLSVPASAIATFGFVFSGWPIFKEAFHDVLERRMTMELSMTIALLAGAVTGYFFVTMLIIFFVLIAEILEGLTVERGRRAIHELLEFLPRNVSVRRAGAIMEVDTDQLAVGETVLVAPGSRIPVDGAVEGGHSFVDESRITGESMPVEKLAGTRVYAGSINQSGALEVRAERIGADTSYGKIIEAVERAERSRAPVTRTADRLAGYIVLFAMAFAGFTQWMWHSVEQSISVLVVAGACGVAAGTPLAILGAIGRAARLGAIVKGGVHIEMLARIDTVVLDKTGTLTFGTPSVTAITPAPGLTATDVLAAAATAEVRSEHPLGKAIIDKAKASGPRIAEPEHFAYTPGRGIVATVGGSRILAGNPAWMRENGVELLGLDRAASGATSDVYVARDRALLGVIAVADTVRPEARLAVKGLQDKGIRTILLTGDNAEVAAAVARDVGIAEVESDMLPEAKLDRVRQLVAEGALVAMVGDGVNDAPALAAAHVGVAMGSGTEVARESADVVLLGNDLARFTETVGVAHWTRAIIWQNFAGTILVDVLGIAAAMAGLIGPVAAIQIHTASELIFILNSARLLPRLALLDRRMRGPAVAAPAKPQPAGSA